MHTPFIAIDTVAELHGRPTAKVLYRKDTNTPQSDDYSLQLPHSALQSLKTRSKYSITNVAEDVSRRPRRNSVRTTLVLICVAITSVAALPHTSSRFHGWAGWH